jgi:hypothetical protein
MANTGQLVSAFGSQALEQGLDLRIPQAVGPESRCRRLLFTACVPQVFLAQGKEAKQYEQEEIWPGARDLGAV